jgi:signal transduction histidine kinase
VKRSAVIFFIAIFVPSLVLGWLALRTAGEQRVLIERQAADLRQLETDAVAGVVRTLVEQRQAAFVEATRELLATHTAPALAENYGGRLGPVWTENGQPFAIAPDGALTYPTRAQGSPKTTEFIRDNRLFLSNAAGAEIYKTQHLQTLETQGNDAWEYDSSLSKKSKEAKAENSQSAKKQVPSKNVSAFNRNIVPQYQEEAPQTALPSKLAPEYSDFQSAVRGSAQGILARFVEDKLQVLFWTRPDPKSNWLFGLMLGPDELNKMALEALESVALDPSVRLAILNDKSRPVAREPEGFEENWKRPFVASEIGEVLPHWEVALYLSNPGQLTESARLVTLTLVLLIALALAAILAGGYFVAADTRRQLALAQKKTDFVSNVSHELKTPLTSIRMFADLLAEGRVKEPEKRDRYLRIISSESERLTRLVNNVLDFARLERNRKVYEMRETDLHAVVERIWEAESGRLREAGFSVTWDAAPGPYRMVCDTDGVSQVLVNLIANAEKYATRRREITLRTGLEDGWFVAEVLDRGPGVPRGLEEKIFEAFFRADDSLASGVQGSGLGLTLARRIARDHGGDLTCHLREGGGTVFRFRIPNRPPIHP